MAAIPEEGVHMDMETYVQQRVRAFARDFAKELVPDMAEEQLEEITSRILSAHTPNEPPPLAVQPAAPIMVMPAMSTVIMGAYKLEFRHECLALGCRDAECQLCQYNPTRVCERHFSKKYLVGDVLKAKCGSPIRVELIDPSGQLVDDPMVQQMVQFEINLVDGVRYKDIGGESRDLTDEELKSCFRLANHKDEALLQYKLAGQNSGHQSRRINVKLDGGYANLPDMQVTDSSEALLTGRRPPFRLVVWAADAEGNVSPVIKPAISEDFVVATRRVKQANKVEIPLVEDHVSKIEHIGRETIKKLADMRQAALDGGVDIQVDERMARIETVGQFQQLVRVAEHDSQLRKVLQIILKLSKEKWDEAAAHANTAVVPDFRRRVWYPPNVPPAVGLVFNCKYGTVQLRESISLAQTAPDGSVNVMPEDRLDPGSLEVLRDLRTTAIRRWHETRHPGWNIFREPNEAVLEAAMKAHSGMVAGGIPMVGMKRSASQADLEAESQYVTSMPLDAMAVQMGGSAPVDAAQALVGMQTMPMAGDGTHEGVALPDGAMGVAQMALTEEQLQALIQQGMDPSAMGLQAVDLGDGQVVYVVPQTMSIDPSQLPAETLAAMGLPAPDADMMAAVQGGDGTGVQHGGEAVGMAGDHAAAAAGAEQAADMAVDATSAAVPPAAEAGEAVAPAAEAAAEAAAAVVQAQAVQDGVAG